MCPAPRTITYEPTKRYFSATEAREKIGCSKYWLWHHSAVLAFNTRPRGKWHRYSVEEINALMEIRKMKK
jgi:hypothetical protein